MAFDMDDYDNPLLDLDPLDDLDDLDDDEGIYDEGIYDEDNYDDALGTEGWRHFVGMPEVD